MKNCFKELQREQVWEPLPEGKAWKIEAAIAKSRVAISEYHLVTKVNTNN